MRPNRLSSTARTSLVFGMSLGIGLSPLADRVSADTGPVVAHVLAVNGDWLVTGDGYAAPHHVTPGMELFAGDVLRPDPALSPRPPASRVDVSYAAPIPGKGRQTRDACGPSCTAYTVADVSGQPAGAIGVAEAVLSHFFGAAAYGVPASTQGVVDEAFADGVATTDGTTIAFGALGAAIDPDDYLISIVPVARDGSLDAAHAVRLPFAPKAPGASAPISADVAPGLYAVGIVRQIEPDRPLGPPAWILLTSPADHESKAAAYAAAVETASAGPNDGDARRAAHIYTRAALLVLAQAPR